MFSKTFSNFAACCFASRHHEFSLSKKCYLSRFFSSPSTKSSSPDWGTSVKLRISAGIEGPADCICHYFHPTMPVSYQRRLQLNNIAFVKRPCLHQNSCHGPLPLSILASTINPLAIESTGLLTPKLSLKQNIF